MVRSCDLGDYVGFSIIFLNVLLLFKVPLQFFTEISLRLSLKSPPLGESWRQLSSRLMFSLNSYQLEEFVRTQLECRDNRSSW